MKFQVKTTCMLTGCQGLRPELLLWLILFLRGCKDGQQITFGDQDPDLGFGAAAVGAGTPSESGYLFLIHLNFIGELSSM